MKDRKICSLKLREEDWLLVSPVVASGAGSVELAAVSPFDSRKYYNSGGSFKSLFLPLDKKIISPVALPASELFDFSGMAYYQLESRPGSPSLGRIPSPTPLKRKISLSNVSNTSNTSKRKLSSISSSGCVDLSTLAFLRREYVLPGSKMENTRETVLSPVINVRPRKMSPSPLKVESVATIKNGKFSYKFAKKAGKKSSVTEGNKRVKKILKRSLMSRKHI
jgi:hypothetical protein